MGVVSIVVTVELSPCIVDDDDDDDDDDDADDDDDDDDMKTAGYIYDKSWSSYYSANTRIPTRN